MGPFGNPENWAKVRGLNGVFSRLRMRAVRESRGRATLSGGGGAAAVSTDPVDPTAEPVEPARSSVGTLKRRGVFDESDTGEISCWAPAGSSGSRGAATPMSSAPEKRRPFGFGSGSGEAEAEALGALAVSMLKRAHHKRDRDRDRGQDLDRDWDRDRDRDRNRDDGGGVEWVSAGFGTRTAFIRMGGLYAAGGLYWDGARPISGGAGRATKCEGVRPMRKRR